MPRSGSSTASTAAPFTSTGAIVLLVFFRRLLAPAAAQSSLYLRTSVGATDYQTWDIPVGPAQRCYRLSCFNHTGWEVNWADIQAVSWIVFYEDPQCGGKSFKTHGGSHSHYYGGDNDDFKASPGSVMVWESGDVPLREIVDACL